MHSFNWYHIFATNCPKGFIDATWFIPSDTLNPDSPSLKGLHMLDDCSLAPVSSVWYHSYYYFGLSGCIALFYTIVLHYLLPLFMCRCSFYFFSLLSPLSGCGCHISLFYFMVGNLSMLLGSIPLSLNWILLS